MSKRSRKCVLGSAVLGLVLAGIGTSTARADYSWTTWNTLNAPDGGDTELYGINSSRQVSGVSFNNVLNSSSGLLFNGTTGTLITAPNSLSTQFVQINNAGQIAGFYGDQNGAFHAAVYNSAGNTWTNLPDSAGADNNLAGGINNNGLVAGNTAMNGAGSTFVNGQGWTYSGGTYSFFTVPNSSPTFDGTVVYSANDAGQVVGFYVDSSGAQHGFVKTGSTVTTLDFPDANPSTELVTSTAALGINNSGVVVGSFAVTDLTSPTLASTIHGFIYQNGTYSEIDYPTGAVNTTVGGINAAGDIVGFYTDATGAEHGFEALVPEPASLGLLAIGALAFARRRRSI